MANFDKVVLITRKTELEELVERFNTRSQAAFYLERMGYDFGAFEKAHEIYRKAFEQVRESIPEGIRFQAIDRSYLPSFLAGERDLIITLGPDGLVVNTAKYLTTQPLLALNPDPSRIDGVLIPFGIGEAKETMKKVIFRSFNTRAITMAEARFNDGQSIFALNDFFVGQRTHVSARYSVSYKGRQEKQSSSGIIVTTGAGSTGWFRSVITGASAVIESISGLKEARKARDSYRFDWEAPYLYFSVREPFISRMSSAELVFGKIGTEESLEVTSFMPHDGVVFSDGIESDYVEFNSGAIVTIKTAQRCLNLVSRQ
jgi:NAD kinase